MKTVSAVLATTHVDRHNEAFALSALEGIVEQLNQHYLPVGVEHDPRVPPLGRVISAELRPRDDREFEVAAQIEVFEPGDRITFGSESRRTIVRYNEGDEIAVIDDRSLSDPDDQTILAELRSILDARTETEAKKAFEPITVLTIAATLIGPKLIDGFLGQIGGDAWSATKDKLKSLFRRKRNSPAQLLDFAATIEVAGERRLVEVILSDPGDADLDAFQREVVDEAVRAVVASIGESPYLVRFVFSYSRKDGLRARFAVATNGAPILFDLEPQATKQIDRLSLGGRAPDA